MEEYIFTIDIGSSSCRCAMYIEKNNDDNNNEAIHIVQKPVSKSEIGTFNADEIVKCVDLCVHQSIEYLREKDGANQFNIKAVGFDCFAMSLVGCELTHSKGLQAITPVYTYANDHPKKATYTNRLKELIKTHYRQNEINSWILHQQTGTTIHASYAASQLLCVQNEEPELFQKVERWTTLTSYILSKWTGNCDVKVGISEASWTGLFNRMTASSHSSPSSTLEWHEGLLNLIGMSTNDFSQIGDSYWEISSNHHHHNNNNGTNNNNNVLKISNNVNYCSKWPEIYNTGSTRFFLGIGDGAAANIGSKATNDTRVAMTIGTSAAMRIVVNDIQFEGVEIPSGLWCYKINRTYSLLGGALTDGGSIYEWLQKTVKLDRNNSKNLEEYVNQNGNEKRLFHHNLTILPFPNGERAPGWVDSATGTITGIKTTTTPEDILIAHLQAIGFRLKEIYDRLKAYLGEGNESNGVKIFCSGTALQNNNLWKAMLADILGADLVSENIKEATSRGVYQLIKCSYDGSNIFEIPEKIDEQAKIYKPKFSNHMQYVHLKNKHDALYYKFYGTRVIDITRQCSICLENLYTTNNYGLIEVTQIKQCQHVFHSKCLNLWKEGQGKTTCPNCRTPFGNNSSSSSSSNNDIDDADGDWGDNGIWSNINRRFADSNNLLFAATATATVGFAYLLNNR